ncbi:MAG: LptF/LptG family permease [bacterium]|nr:LptF/LptG family permease [bacterium]
MRILSRYVQRQFLLHFLLCYVGFLCIFTVVDLAGRLSAFLDQQVPASLIVMYYIWSIPYFSVLILPMATLLASLLCFGNLARKGELVAMKAAGISLYRIVMPVLGVSLLISIAATVLTDRAMPVATQRRQAVERGENPAARRPLRAQVVLRDVRGQILSVRTYFRTQTRGEQVTLDRYRGRKLLRKVRAEKMVWEEDTWVFYKGEVRTFGEDAGQETVQRFEVMPALGLTLLPEDLDRESRDTDQMSYQALEAYIQRKLQNGEPAAKEEVGLHMRLAFPFAAFVMALFGIPLSSRTRRAGKPLLVGICLLVSFIYYGSIQAGRVLGWNSIVSPFLGAWAANLLFMAVGIVMLVRTHK